MGCCSSKKVGEESVLGVIGATGAQGGSVVRAALADQQFTKVRAFTRDPSKESATTIKKAGAEVVALDLDKPDTFDKAFEGLTALFVVTNYWEHMSPSKEKKQVKAVVDAATKAGVKHFVWSTLEDSSSFYDSLPENQRVPKLTADNLYVPHFDAKQQANEYFPKEKTTFLYTSFYLDNLINFGMISKGVLCNNVPQGKAFPVIASEDIGKCAYGIFKAGKTYMGKSVYICGEKCTFSDVMKTVSKVTGLEYKHTTVDRNTYASVGFHGADDLSNSKFLFQKISLWHKKRQYLITLNSCSLVPCTNTVFDYNSRDSKFAMKRDPALAKKLNHELKSVKEWAKANKQALLEVGPTGLI